MNELHIHGDILTPSLSGDSDRGLGTGFIVNKKVRGNNGFHDDFDYPVKVIYYEGCTQINPYMFISRSMDSYAGSFLCSIDSLILPSSIELIGESAFNSTFFNDDSVEVIKNNALDVIEED